MATWLRPPAEAVLAVPPAAVVLSESQLLLQPLGCRYNPMMGPYNPMMGPYNPMMGGFNPMMGGGINPYGSGGE
jgi:hypothetical protein